jgi:GTPase SAR1 family protein
MRGNEPLASAIRQAASYCATRGVKFAAISNGHQLVAFLGARNDGTPPMTGRAVAFRNRHEMEDHFTELWNYLLQKVSPSTISSTSFGWNRAHCLLRNSAGSCMYTRAQNPATQLSLNWTFLGRYSYRIVKAKELEEDFLKECYCTSGALSQYALITKDILKNRYHEAVNRKSPQVVGVTDNTGLTPQLWDALVKRGISRRPIVLLGDVGVGKTTFIRRLVKIDAHEELEKSIVFYIDFGSEPALRRDLEQYIAEVFSKQLETDYSLDIYEDSFVRAVYNGELNQLAKGIYKSYRTSDPDRFMEKEIEKLEELTAKLEAHLRRSLEHLRATQGRNAVVFFDNIDQREVEFQDAVYLVAQSMSENWASQRSSLCAPRRSTPPDDPALSQLISLEYLRSLHQGLMRW